MTEHWTKYRVIKNDTEGVEELSSKPDWVLRIKHCVVRFVWVLSSKSEAYLQLHYIRIKVEPNAWYYTKKTNEFNGVLLVSSRPVPSPNPLSKFKTTVSFRLPAPSLRVSSCLLFSRLRSDTSAKWVSPRRRRWPPADTSRWPPWRAPGRLRQSFSCTDRKK